MAAMPRCVSRPGLCLVVSLVVVPAAVVLLAGCVWGGDAQPTEGSLAVQVRFPEQPGGTVSALDFAPTPCAMFFIADTSLLESNTAHVEEFYELVFDTWWDNEYEGPAQPFAVSVPDNLTGYVQGVVLSHDDTSGSYEFVGLPVGNRYLVAVGVSDSSNENQGWSWGFVVIPEGTVAKIELMLDSHLDLNLGWWLMPGDTFDYFLDQEYGSGLYEPPPPV